jgi:hypothetical protein
MIAGVIASQITLSIPTTWSYIGTTGTQNGSVDAGTTSSCRTSGTLQSWLMSNYPPGNYSNGYIMRVTSAWFDGFDGGLCTNHFYQAQ